MKSLLEIMQRVANGMTKEEANDVLAEQVKEMVILGDSKEEATARMRVNIGYFAGYYSHEIADKAYELFDTEHPIFGKLHPSPQEAARLGIEYGRRSKERSLIDSHNHPH